MTMRKTTTMTMMMIMMMMLLIYGVFSPFVVAIPSPLSLPLTLSLPLESTTSTSLLASLSSTFPGRGGSDGDGGDGGITDGDNVIDTTSKKKSSIVIRVRLMDGSMERIQLDADTLESVTLGDVLQPFDIDIDDGDENDSDASIRISINNNIVDTSYKTTTLQVLNVKHGSLITMSPSPTAVKKKKMRDANAT